MVNALKQPVKVDHVFQALHFRVLLELFNQFGIFLVGEAGDILS